MTAETNPNQEIPRNTTGLKCRKCGCRHFYVVSTERKPHKIVRYRRCRHCGKKHTTTERLDAETTQ